MSTDDEVLEQLSKAIDFYSDNIPLRSIIASIPIVGGSLDVVFSTQGQKNVQRRLVLLITQLQIDYRSLEERVIDKNFVKSEEFFDLLVKVLDASARTRHDEKIRIYARILCNSTINEYHILYNPEDYVDVLSELSIQELHLARRIYLSQKSTPQNDKEADLGWVKRCGWEHIIESVPAEDINFLLKRLERTGLITEVMGMYLGYSGGVYKITDTFRKMMEFLNLNE